MTDKRIYIHTPNFENKEDINLIVSTILDKRGFAKLYNIIFTNSPKKADIILKKKCKNYMDKKFPTLSGFSVTVMSSIGPNKIYINDFNWNNLPKDFEDTLITYRQYVIQHELGHAIANKGHTTFDSNIYTKCPVMYQQTRGTKNKCIPNPWLF